jgi:hypothetical protein
MEGSMSKAASPFCGDVSEDENIPCYSCGADKDTPCDEMTCPFRIANRAKREAQQMDANGDDEDTSEDDSDDDDTSEDDSDDDDTSEDDSDDDDTSEDDSDDDDTSEDENIPCYSCSADKDTPCDEMTCPFRIANRAKREAQQMDANGCGPGGCQWCLWGRL